MRVFNFIISGLIVAVGIVVALFVMVVGLVVFALRRLFGQRATLPRFQRIGVPPRPATRPAYTHRDVIDVEATPVKE